MDQWYVTRGSSRKGPFTSAQLRILAKKGQVRATDLLAREGSDKWVAAGKMPDLFPPAPAVPEATPVTLPPRSSPAPLGIRPVFWIGAGAVGVCLIVVLWIVLGRSGPVPSPETKQVAKQPSTTETPPPSDKSAKTEAPSVAAKKEVKVEPAPPFAVSPDVALDLLLRLLGQNGLVNNELIALNNRTAWNQADLKRVWELQKILASGADEETRADKIWVSDVQRLSRARVPHVPEAAEKLQPTVALLTKVFQAEENRKRLRAELAKNSGGSSVNRVEAQIELLHGPDEFQLDDMVRKKLMTREEADARLQIRNRVKNALIQEIGNNLVNSYVSGVVTLKQTYYLRNRAEILRSALVQEALRPVLQARAGAAQAKPPLDVMFSAIRKGDNIHAVGIGDKRGFVAIRSRSAQELARLTLLMEVQTTLGNRYAAFYVPRLSPSGSGYFDPFTLSGAALVGDANFLKLAEFTGASFSVWCDQFRAENQSPQIVAPEQLVKDVYLQALAPGLVYVSEGGFFMSDKEFFEASRKPGFKMPKEPHRRFEVTVKRLTPSGDAFEVDVDLLDRQVKSPPQRFSGKFQLPFVKSDAAGNLIFYSDTLKFGQMGKPELEKLMLKLRSSTQELEMNLQGLWNTPERRWAMNLFDSAQGNRPRQGLAARKLWSAWEIPAPESPEGIAVERLRAATNMPPAEARQAYEKIIADYPGSDWSVTAKFAIDNLEANKKQ